MILIGRYRSPFTRRVAISMNLLGMPYEHRPMTTWTHLSEVRALNPVGRIPALVLDDGEVLFDSAAILDYLDSLAGPDRALVPTEIVARRECLRCVACAMGALEKIVAALYERTMRPAQKVHPEWIRHNEDQARNALRWLDDAFADRPCFNGRRLSQADISTVAMFDFARIVNPGLVPLGAYARLDQLVERLDVMDAFARTLPTGEVDQANPSLPSSTSTRQHS